MKPELRVRLKDLERARLDPGAYLRDLAAPGRRYGKSSKHSSLLNAVHHYHTTSGNLPAALAHLDTLFEKFNKNPASQQLYQGQLSMYADAYEKLGYGLIKSRDNLILKLPEEFKDKAEVYGQAARIDMTPNGYAVWVFEKKTGVWRDEIRFPLMQAAYADKFGADLDEVTMGVYDFSTVSHIPYSFTEKDVDEAQTVLYGLLRQLLLINSQGK